MTTPSQVENDTLRPTRAATEAAWSDRVAAAREQLDRQREIGAESEPYPYSGDRFRVDPTRRDDAVVAALFALADAGDTWLDIGAGVGRYALPLADVVERVIAIEPSAQALAILQADARQAGLSGIEVRQSQWPLPGRSTARADAALMAHVGYGVDDIGAFLDAAERAARRVCVAVMGEGPMAIMPRLLWAAVHGEKRIITPALPELLSVLMSRGVLPTLSYAPRLPVTRPSVEGLIEIARRQLWLQAGSARDGVLVDAVREMATEQDGRWALEWSTTRIGIAAWGPRPDLS